jgi:endo-1,4-beta-mannosidase
MVAAAGDAEDQMKRPNPKVMLGDKPQTWVGANFWSANGGPLMWRTYDPAIIDRELDHMYDNGMTLTRSFFYWPDFQPTPDSIDEGLVARYRDFLERHDRRSMQTIPTFIVGHMSGQNWDPAWRGGRDLFSDVWFVARQAWYVRELTRRFADHRAIAAWLLTNEMPIYADWKDRGIGVLDPDVVTSWAQILIDAVRAGGGTQPVSVGDGAWGVEATGRDHGFRVRELSPLVDFLGPHVYRMETDQVRQHLGAAFVCDLLHRDDQPIIMEEFGVTSEFTSDENAAHYYRQLLHHTLLAGATGWIAWNNTDFDGLAAQAPYTHRPFELHFGLIDDAHQPKPAAVEMRAFADLITRIDLSKVTRPDSRIALVASSYYDNQYPFTDASDGPTIISNLRQAYVAAREADLPVTIVRESDAVAWRPGTVGDIRRGAARGSNQFGRATPSMAENAPLDTALPLEPGQSEPSALGQGLPTDAALYLVPSVKALTSPTWNQLADLARGGAVVYASFFVGTHLNQRGPWWSNMHELFGVEKLTRYGLVNPIEDDVLEMTFLEAFGDIKAGSTLRFVVAGNANSRSFLPVAVTDGSIIAVDDRRRPALVRNRLGEGSAILCTYPIEYMAAETAAVNPEDTWKLYRALAVEAGVTPEVQLDSPDVVCGEMVHEDGRRFVWLINMTPDPLTASPRLASGSLRGIDGGTPVTSVRLPAFGVAVLERR